MQTHQFLWNREKEKVHLLPRTMCLLSSRLASSFYRSAVTIPKSPIHFSAIEKSTIEFSFTIYLIKANLEIRS